MSIEDKEVQIQARADADAGVRPGVRPDAGMGDPGDARARAQMEAQMEAQREAQREGQPVGRGDVSADLVSGMVSEQGPGQGTGRGPGPGAAPGGGAGCHQADVCQNETPLVRHIFVLHHLMMRVGDRLASELGLTASRWLLLCAIGRAEQPPNVGELSDEATLSPQNISRMLVAMEGEGLIERFSRKGMGRAVFVRLTPAGQRAYEQTQELALRFGGPFLEGFDEHELISVSGALGRLIENLSRYEQELASARDGTEGSSE